jgi:Protein of unknown function (DUF1648)
MYWWLMKLSGGLLAVSIFLSILLLWSLPEAASIAIHFGASGQPDRTVSVGVAAILFPFVIAVAWLIFYFQARMRTVSQEATDSVIWIGVVGILTLAHAVVVAKALGSGLNPAVVMTGALIVFAAAWLVSWLRNKKDRSTQI